MKLVITLLLSLVTIVITDSDDYKIWEEFKQKFNKTYKHWEEEFRREIFLLNKFKIDTHNALDRSYKLELNHFADMTDAEFASYVGLNEFKLPMISRIFGSFDVEIPEKIDWREKGAVTKVKDQKTCSSCYTFSTVGALEAQYFLKSNELISFSTQELVDCTEGYNNQGCHGGFMENDYLYIKDHGLRTEDEYPYVAEDGTCKKFDNSSKIKLKDYVFLEKNEKALQKAIATIGPISVAVSADIWKFYESGILDSCPTENINHGVVVVGYGTENGEDYYLVKNSWSERWGEKGYIRVRRNSGNICNILDYASYPILE